MPEWMPRAMVTAYLIAILGLLLAPALVSERSAQAQERTRTAAWAPVDCATFKLDELPPESGVECGYVTAPLRHTDPGGPTIQLATVILPSAATDRRPDPLFMAQGGPGGSTIETYARYLISSPEARPTQNRDIVLWDQRGTLHSKPALLCPEVSQENLRAATSAGQPAPGGDGLDAYRTCGARLATEAGDLSAFNSSENADDAEAVRAALGYAQFNFYGVSYGTELGQFIMRQQPEHLRSVVLDAVVPLSYNLFTEPAFAKQRIADKYFGACEADARCNAAFPNLRERYRALYERLNASPVTLTVAPPTMGAQSYPVRLDGAGLEGALYQALYGDTHAVIPLIVDRADKGDYTFLAAFLLPYALFDTTFAEGMHLTVACADRADANPDAVDYSQINPRLAEQERADARAELALCKTWGVELLPRAELEPVRSEIPVLLLSGDFDPITPPQYAAQLLPKLPNSQHVIFPLGAHGQAVTSPCSNGIIGGFLDNPLAPVDTACVPAEGPRFVTDADLLTLPTLRQALNSGGLMSWSMLGFISRSVPGLLGALFLLSAVLVYPIAWIVGRVRHSPAAGAAEGWTVGWSRAAPWLAFAAGLVLLAFLLGLGFAIGTTLAGDQNLFLLGAIASRWRWLFFLPLLAILLVGLMAVSAVALWSGHHRSLAGRIYYTLLLLAGLLGLGSMAALGVLGLAFG